MAVKQVTRYEATDGTLFTDERAAQKYQDSLNNVDRDKFRKETFDKLITTQLESKDAEIVSLYKRLVKGDIDFDESQSFFERVWLGKITNTSVNQRGLYTTMLNTILGNDETHIKADGIYDLVIGAGAKTLMTRGKEGTSLSTTVGLETYTLEASPGGFTLNSGKGILGTAQFVDNRWSIKGPSDTITITWQAGL